MAPPPATTRREIELDFIRGIAILLVLAFHFKADNLLTTSRLVDRIQGIGWVGVDVFFVLSGFLVGGLLMREWSRTGAVDSIRFLQRRAFKIWPAYYAFLFVVTLAHPHLYKSFFWQNFLNVQDYVHSRLAHTWSLAIEEQFYLLLAATIALWTAKHWRPILLLRGCLLTAVAIEVLRAVLTAHGRPTYFFAHTRLDALLLGVALAAIRTFWPHWFATLQRQRALLLTVLAIGLWRLAVDRDAYPVPDALTSPFLITFVDYASAALLLLLYHPGGKHGWIYRQVARIGVFSYGIYLWHIDIQRPLDWSVAHVPHAFIPITSTLLPYVLAIIFGAVATKLIELPFLRLRQHLVPSRTPEPQIPAA